MDDATQGRTVSGAIRRSHPRLFRTALACAVLAIGTTSGCATVPPEAVVAQQLVIKNIEVARTNQLLLIDSYAADQKDTKRRQFEDVALGRVVQTRLANRAAMPPDEVVKLAKDYTADLQGELEKIDLKARSLREKTNSDFDRLVELAQINADYTSALKDRSDIVNRLSGKYKAQLDKVQSEFAQAVQAP